MEQDNLLSNDTLKSPLYQVLGNIAALWALAMVGYYVIFPLFGYELSYNSDPIRIAFYFLFWGIVSMAYFWNLFSKWLVVNSHIWLYLALSLGFSTVLLGLLYVFSQFPTTQGPLLAPYTDILFATPWYFLPKSMEILVQQILITILVLELHYRFHSFKAVLTGYVVCFGGAHVLLFLATGAPTLHATIMTLGAVFSTFVFPYFILRIKGGFVYSYAIHFAFYLLLAMVLHTLPPIGYGL